MHDDLFYDSFSNSTVGTGSKNAAYLINGQTVTLKDGYSDVAQADSSAKIITSYLGNPIFGDLNNDGFADTAFILTQQSSGGSGVFYYMALALGGSNGTVIGKNALLLGDRISPVSVENNNGTIVVTYLDRQPNEPMTATPSVTVVRNFKIVNGQLEEIK